MKKVIKRAARWFGYDVLTYTYAKDVLMNHHLAQLFARANIRCVLDVGANVGQFRDFLRDAVGFDGWIISFEPVARHAQQLKARAQHDTRWLVYPFALGDEDGEADINVTSFGELSSFSTPLRLDSAMTVEHRERVTVSTLDNLAPLVETTCPLRFTYLKVDTQGHDLRVLQGARKALRHIPALQTEVSFIPIYHGTPTFFDVYEYLRDYEFAITGMFPVSRDSLLRAVEFDCVMINGRTISSLDPSIRHRE